MVWLGPGRSPLEHKPQNTSGRGTTAERGSEMFLAFLILPPFGHDFHCKNCDAHPDCLWLHYSHTSLQILGSPPQYWRPCLSGVRV